MAYWLKKDSGIEDDVAYWSAKGPGPGTQDDVAYWSAKGPDPGTEDDVAYWSEKGTGTEDDVAYWSAKGTGTGPGKKDNLGYWSAKDNGQQWDEQSLWVPSSPLTRHDELVHQLLCNSNIPEQLSVKCL